MATDPARLISDAEAAEPTPAMARQAITLLDLTSLRGDEAEEEIAGLCRRAMAHGAAAVCLYPSALPTARQQLQGSGVRLATVANFPEGGDDLARTADEVAAAVAEGAVEVDVVAPIEAARSGDIGLVGELVGLCREAAGPDITLKLILETGRLETPDIITAVARSGVMAGADFLKTSTGKVATGATFEAAAVLLAVLEEAEGRVGLKLSGGIRTAKQAAGYLHLVRHFMGEGWIDPGHVRFGASTLLDDLLRETETS